MTTPACAHMPASLLSANQRFVAMWRCSSLHKLLHVLVALLLLLQTFLVLNLLLLFLQATASCRILQFCTACCYCKQLPAASHLMPGYCCDCCSCKHLPAASYISALLLKLVLPAAPLTSSGCTSSLRAARAHSSHLPACSWLCLLSQSRQ